MKSTIYLFASIILLFLVVITANAQQLAGKDTSGIVSDTTSILDSFLIRKPSIAVDSLKNKIDSTALVRIDTSATDSVRIRFIPGMGQIIKAVDTTDALHQSQFLWSDAKYVGDMLWKLPGFFYRDLGEAGKWGELNAFGVDGRGIGIFLDGRPMNDPITGTYNLYDLPLEFIDHTEIISGSTSLMSGSAGTTLNFVSRSYNSYRPMTKLRFVQDPKGTILTDGLFTQNVARGLNLMFGFQRHVTAGRYTNANLDAWNIRTRLRYNISDRLNISLTDFYTKADNGLNGGIPNALAIDLNNEGNVNVQNNNSWDKRTRRDVTLSTIARILSDSSSTMQVSFYYSTLDREYQNSLQNIDDSSKAAFWGMRLQQRLSFNPIHLTLGGYLERRESDSTRTLTSHLESEKSVFAQAELQIIKTFVPSITLRSTSLNGESAFSTGIGIKSTATDWLIIFADVSRYDRFPTLQERYWKDSTIIRTSEIRKEQHNFIQGGFIVSAGSNFQLNLTGFQRIVKNAIVFQPAVTINNSPAISISNVSEMQIIGVNGKLLLRWGHFEALGVMTFTRSEQEDTLKKLIPDLICAGEVSYRDMFFKDKLDAKFGVRSSFYNRQQGMQFDPQTLSYIQYQGYNIGRATIFDLFMILKIGDAHISVSWDNILNTPYILAPVYPMPGRHFRLGVNWLFVD